MVTAAHNDTKPADRLGAAPLWPWITTAVAVVAVAIALGVSFLRQAEAARATEVELALLARHAATMEALEWRAIAERSVSPELAANIAEVVSRTRASIHLASKDSVRVPALTSVGSTYGVYLGVLSEELGLIAAQRVDEARALDVAKVDPTFAALEAAIDRATADNGIRTHEVVRNRTLAAAGVIIATSLALLLLAWRYGRARLAVELAKREEATLLRTNVALRAEVAERRAAQEEVRRLLRHSEMLLSASSDGILGVDHAGRHTFVNPAAAAQLGYKPSELLGKSSHRVWHHSRADGTPYPEAECPIVATFRGGASQRIDHEVFWRADGTSFPVAYASSPIFDGDMLVGAVITFRDVSGEREDALLRDHLLNSLQSALASARTLGGFLPICSHCKRVRDSDDQWSEVELFMARFTDISFSHGVCPDCLQKHYAEFVTSSPIPNERTD